MTAAARGARGLGVAVVALGLLLAVGAQLHGWRAVPVLSGSMTPYAPQGSLVLTVPVAPSAVEVGDVVAFAPPAPYARGHHPVMHRVVALDQREGTTAMTTRGDANPQADPWTVDLEDADLGRAAFVVPGAGWLFMAGPGAALALLLGAAAVAEGASVLRRSRCSCAAPVVETDAAPAVSAPVEQIRPTSAPTTVELGASAGRVPVQLPAPRRPADGAAAGADAVARSG